ncbi:bifunctional diguanylate cyclase/phosphodiesterase [Noviherbaspirillum aerium]|uniref:bifunctional diguanylate cyclase/phosphodiesterase n=1 Tax=Noviherbaspirillum aerium TaxID=2588497 RepID=UPI00178C2644|nr:EAL domain-containing protein [Noviherbaspirillum aerium]
MLLWPVIGISVIYLLWVFTLSLIGMERRNAEAAALRLSASLSRAYAAQLERTIQEIDQLTLLLRYSWEEPGASLDLERQRDRGLFPGSAQLHATILDRDGNIVSSTMRSHERPNFADMPYFQRHRSSPDSGLQISQVSPGRRIGRDVVRFTRRLTAKDGTFGGVAVIVVEPSYLTTFHDAQTLGAGDFVSVRFINGSLIATKTGDHPSKVYYRKDPVFLSDTGTEVEPREKFVDGQARFFSWNRLNMYPVVALAAIAERNALAGYEKTAFTYRRFAYAISALIAAFTVAGMFFTLRLAWRKRREEEIQTTMRLATDAANEGFYTIRPIRDRNAFITDFLYEDCNERGAELLGLPKAEVRGHRFSEFIPEDYREDLFALFRRALSSGFHEDEFRVPKNSRLRATWVYRRMVRSGDGLALTMRDISQAKENEFALSRLANTDALTMLPNRHWLSTFLPEALRRSAGRDGALALLFIDLDNFKNINDTLGHDAGDELLRSAAARLKSVVRASDHVVRLGGDEFIIVLENVDLVEDVSRVASHIVRVIGDPFTLGTSSIHHVNASIGISLFPQDGNDSDTLLKHADIAMYAAKAAGKGRYHFYHSHLSDTLLLKLDKEKALRDAVARDQFVMHYQPRVEAVSGRLSSMEALVRWKHPDRGLIYPNDFIGLAEDTGLILPLGELVIEKVCAQIAEWKAGGMAVVPVSVNVSALQLRNEHLAGFFSDCLRRHAIDSSLIEVELTESAMLDNSAVARRQLAELRKVGVKLLIDDFGTGYSSLAQLHQLDVDVLKVDRAFTTALADGNGEVMFRAVTSMAEALEIRVVAEGVETAEQLRSLQRLHCDEVQGYLIAKALPATEIPSLIMQRFLFAEV